MQHHEQNRRCDDNPSVLKELEKYWTVVAAVFGLLIGIYGFLATNGWINGPVHASEFTALKQHIEEHEREDVTHRVGVKDVVVDIRNDVKSLVYEQVKQGRAIERIEAKQKP